MAHVEDATDRAPFLLRGDLDAAFRGAAEAGCDGLVGLGGRLDHFPSQLSGGEQQRVAIARAVAKRPSVLLCDEPTGALDFRTGILVLEVIEQVNRELGTATAVITHNAPIADIADRVVTLADGRVQTERAPGRLARARDLRW